MENIQIEPETNEMLDSAKVNTMESSISHISQDSELSDDSIISTEQIISYSLQTFIRNVFNGKWKSSFLNEWAKFLNVLSQLNFIKRIMNFLQNVLLTILQMGPLPRHISFIMDGNRRYAKSLNLPLKRGHEEGSLTLLRTLHICKKVGIEVASAYAFSIENFNRPKEEVDILTDMMGKRLQELANRANNLKDKLYGAKVFIVGDRSLLSDDLNDKISHVESMTKHNSAFVVYICLPYTTRNDILHSMHEIIKLCKTGAISSKDISIELLTNSMYLGTSSNKADILVRTSGHTRLSDYMLWQTHENSIIEFSGCMWPDFTFFTFYFVLLKWSYYTTVQRARKRKNLRTKFGSFAKTVLTQKNFPPVSLESLPPPPVAVSVNGK